ncbi:metallopeptidase family protein [Corynebacterium sp. H78]|uniref:metallopeptidase family protein n=1 Tax=Corynebacterium sp. H78 TaxID=3133417 RepID=UPI0030A1A581
MVAVSEERFDQLVDEAIDRIPHQFLHQLGNVVIQVQPRHPQVPTLLGLYEGVPLTKRQANHWGPPDCITLYRDMLCSISHSEEALIEQIRVTLLHEIGHFFGLDEEDLDRLGYG